jgi:hypothetical protein
MQPPFILAQQKRCEQAKVAPEICQDAAKVRSFAGLQIRVFGKLSTAFFLIALNSLTGDSHYYCTFK